MVPSGLTKKTKRTGSQVVVKYALTRECNFLFRSVETGVEIWENTTESGEKLLIILCCYCGHGIHWSTETPYGSWNCSNKCENIKVKSVSSDACASRFLLRSSTDVSLIKQWVAAWMDIDENDVTVTYTPVED